MVREELRRQLDEVVGLQDAVRADEPDAVHATRVALRTMRGLLAIFAPILEPPGTRRLCRELRWGGRQLTDARDLEVLQELFSDELPGEAARPVLDDLDRRYAVAHAHGVAGLNSPRWAAMIALAASVLASPTSIQSAQAPRLQTLRDLIDVHVEHQVRPRLAVADKNPTDLPLWHEVRKAVKSARYAWEMVAVLPEANDADRTEAQRWQTTASALGALQDTAVMTEAVAAYLASLPTHSPAVSVLVELQIRLFTTTSKRLAIARPLLPSSYESHAPGILA